MYCQYTYNMVGVIKVKTEVLRMLKETDDYLSGQEICERLNVSRTAVWKVIKQLEAEGYEIEAVRNRGYRLRFLGDVLSQAELESSIDSEWAGKNILYFDETDSTNTEIKKAAEKDAPHGTLAVADYQSMGKGRRGRSWAAPHGVGIWMSLLLRPELPPTCASMLTLVAALAVADGIREVCDLEAKIKWPNDIVVNTPFHVEIGNLTGEFNICLPFSMIEPLRELLVNPPLENSRNEDQNWRENLVRQVQHSQLELVANFADISMRLSQILKLQPGDVLPIDKPDRIIAHVDGVPVLTSQYGTINGQYALRVEHLINPILNSLNEEQPK